jgi:hypothetical protein
MDKVYVLFIKRFPQRPGENYVYLPTYEIHYKPVEGKKVAELGVGDCVDTYRCELSEDGTYVHCYLYTVSNIDGKAQENLTESFIIARDNH